MTKRDVGSLALTIVGLYAIVAAIKYAGTMVGLIESAARAEHSEATLRYVVVGSMLAFGALIAVGCVLLVFSGELSARMFDDGEEKVVVSASLRDVQAAAFSVVGLLFIFFSLPSLLRSTARVLLSLDHQPPLHHPSRSTGWADKPTGHQR